MVTLEQIAYDAGRGEMLIRLDINLEGDSSIIKETFQCSLLWLRVRLSEAIQALGMAYINRDYDHKL